MTDQSFEHRCIIVLPPAEVYATTDALNLIALAVRNRDNDGPPDAARPPILHWNIPAPVCNPSDCSVFPNDVELQSHSADHHLGTPKQKEPQLIWDDRAERIKSSLCTELYQSVRNGHLNVWSLFCDMVKAPPSDLSDINFWIATSTIYRSDLIKFCRSQKIKVEIDPIAAQPEVRETFNQDNAESRKGSGQNANRPPHWADYEELSCAFPAVGKTKSDTTKYFMDGSADHKRKRGFKEAYIDGTGGSGSGNRSQFDIFAIAKHLHRRKILKQWSIEEGLRKHFGAALDDYKDQYDNLF